MKTRYLFSIPLFFCFSSVICQQTKQPELNFFGNGNIQKSLDSGEKIPASTGLGVNWNYWFPENATPNRLSFDKLELDAMINVAATVDTLIAKYNSNNTVANSSSFGGSLLTPLNSGQAVKLNLRMNFRKPIFFKYIIDGVKIKYVGSNRNWKFVENSAERVVQATTNYFRVGVFQEFLTKELLDHYSINFGLYLAYNSIQGDMGQKKNEGPRSVILNTPNTNFWGPEMSLEIRLKNLRAEFGYSWLGINDEVIGLTGGRLVTTISFVGGFGLKLKD